MRILHIAPQFAYFGERTIVGGYARSLLDLAIQQSVAHDVRICAHLPFPRESVDGTSVELLNVAARGAPGRRSAGVRFLFGLLFALRGQRKWADAVHFHSGYSEYLLIAWVIRFVLRKPVMHSLYCPVDEPSGALGSVRTALLARVARELDAVSGMSENVCRSVRSVLRRQDVALIPPAIDSRYMLHQIEQRGAQARERLGLDADTPTVLYVGNTSRQKNLSGTIEAFAAILREEPHAMLVVTTELSPSSPDPEIRALLHRAEELGVRSRLVHQGIVSDMPALMWACDVIVTPFLSTRGPSDYFMAAVEAVVMGRIVVSANVGGMAEVIDGRSGSLISPTDIDALARALLAALGRGPMAESTISETRLRFSPDAVAAEVERCYVGMIR